MIRKCTHCKGKLDETYRINSNGDRFCDDDCYEEYYMENEDAEEDVCHPYLDDYEGIRSDYIHLLEWEKYGFDINENKLNQLIDFIDTIDSIQYDYLSYYLAEGDDGIFAWEIYQFYLKMEDLKERMRKWKPYRDYEYHLTFKLDCEENFMDDWWSLSKYLREQRWNKLYKILRGRVYSEEDMVFRFLFKKDLDEAVNEIRNKFKDYDVHIDVDIIDYCDGGCGTKKVLSKKARIRKRGWYFCKNCKRYNDPKKLLEED